MTGFEIVGELLRGEQQREKQLCLPPKSITLVVAFLNGRCKNHIFAKKQADVFLIERMISIFSKIKFENFTVSESYLFPIQCQGCCLSIPLRDMKCYNLPNSYPNSNFEIARAWT